MVARGHDFTQDITDLGDMNYGVYVGDHTDANYQVVRFDGHWNDNDANTIHADNDIWALLVTRARDQKLGIDPTVAHTTTEWQASGVLDESRALADLTGRAATKSVLSGTGATNAISLQASLAAGQNAVARSNASTGTSGITANQAFGVRGVTLRPDGVYVVTLFNPTGLDGNNTFDLNLPGNAYHNDGIITLTWYQFRTNFQSISVA